MKIVVLKFGGTSVGTINKIKKVAKIISEYKNRNYKVIVISSAMSGVTNELINKSSEICKNFSNAEYDVLVSSDSLKYIEHAKDFNKKYCPKNTIYFHQRSKKTASDSATLEDLLDEIFENKSF